MDRGRCIGAEIAACRGPAWLEMSALLPSTSHPLVPRPLGRGSPGGGMGARPSRSVWYQQTLRRPRVSVTCTRPSKVPSAPPR